MKMIINTVRKIDHDQAKEHAFGDDDTLKDNVALALINPDNFKELNIKANVKVSSQFGSVILQCKEDKDVPKGMIYIPVSIWANQLTGIENEQLVYKNIKGNVEPTNESVLDFKELITKIRLN